MEAKIYNLEILYNGKFVDYDNKDYCSLIKSDIDALKYQISELKKEGFKVRKKTFTRDIVLLTCKNRKGN